MKSIAQTSDEDDAHRVHALLFRPGLLQIVGFLSNTEPFPVLADALIDLRLWNIWNFLLHELVNIKVVQQVCRPKIERFCIYSQHWNFSPPFLFIKGAKYEENKIQNNIDIEGIKK